MKQFRTLNFSVNLPLICQIFDTTEAKAIDMLSRLEKVGIIVVVGEPEKVRQSADYDGPLSPPLMKSHRVKKIAQEHWVKQYGVEMCKEELTKALSWIYSNPTRAPKSDYGRFFNNWFLRAWEWKRKQGQREVNVINGWLEKA